MASVVRAPGKKVVAVVGAGHVEGMINNLKGAELIDREALSVIPPKAWWVGTLKWIIPALIFAAFYVGYQSHSEESFQRMLEAWILPNMLMGALVSLIALPRPLSVVTAAVASPITSLNPMLGAGMVVGLVEAWLRKPTVADSESLLKDAETIKGLYRNPFSRVLLVALFATLGSALGAWIGVFLIALIFQSGV